jgi:hypothetical protein
MDANTEFTVLLTVLAVIAGLVPMLFRRQRFVAGLLVCVALIVTAGIMGYEYWNTIMNPQRIFTSALLAGWLFMTIAIGSWGWQQFIKPQNLSNDRARTPLTADQREFRLALKQFALTCPASLQNHVGQVARIVQDREKETSGRSAASKALHFFIHFSTSSNMQGLNNLLDLGKVNIEDMDVTAIQNDIDHFLSDYRWRQVGIANLNQITKIDLSALEQMKEWLAFDAECRKELLKMKAWAEAEKISGNNDDKWASTGKSWAKPEVINY